MCNQFQSHIAFNNQSINSLSTLNFVRHFHTLTFRRDIEDIKISISLKSQVFLHIFMQNKQHKNEWKASKQDKQNLFL